MSAPLNIGTGAGVPSESSIVSGGNAHLGSGMGGPEPGIVEYDGKSGQITAGRATAQLRLKYCEQHCRVNVSSTRV